MWHLGGVAVVSKHLNGHNSVIFALRCFKCCVVVDIEVTDKLRGIPKGVWHLGGVALVSIH